MVRNCSYILDCAIFPHTGRSLLDRHIFSKLVLYPLRERVLRNLFQRTSAGKHSVYFFFPVLMRPTLSRRSFATSCQDSPV